ncbi:MAG: response regulator transcription factor [Gemmatimonadetes bacterium]|nr:response regulator transcription factor [Gemmatimonadota bacterium]
MTCETILLVEDAPDVRASLRAALEELGSYQVHEAENGAQALVAFFELRPDLVLLDIGLPKMSGFDVCERVREMSDVPVVVLSARGEVEAKVEALRKGADDYVVKGGSMNELLARIEAGLRRARATASRSSNREVHADGALRLDLGRATATVRGEPVELTPTEFKLLSLLVQHPGRPFGTEELAHRIWGAEDRSEDQVKWHVGHLRRKIERDWGRPEMVVTRRGFGYAYMPPEATVAHRPAPAPFPAPGQPPFSGPA